MISIRIVSEDRLFTEALAGWLESREGFDVRRGDSPRLPVDVVLVDASSGREAALSRVWKIRDSAPDVKLVVLSVEREDDSVVDFIEAGASGYLLKDTSPDDLAGVIQRVHGGEGFGSPTVLAAVVERIVRLSRERESSRRPDLKPLTGREQEILALMARGLRNKEIGRHLQLAVHTVKNHVHNILNKLQVRRRREAVRVACEWNLLAGPHGPQPEEAEFLNPF